MAQLEVELASFDDAGQQVSCYATGTSLGDFALKIIFYFLSYLIWDNSFKKEKKGCEILKF